MLIPKKQKHRKSHRLRGKHYGKATSGTLLSFGSYGIKAVTGGEVNERQIEAARKAISHSLKRGGKTWIRIFPHMPVTKKGAEVPMGSGKGSPEYHVARVRPGNVIMEIDGITESFAREALRLAQSKLPIKTRIISHNQ